MIQNNSWSQANIARSQDTKVNIQKSTTNVEDIMLNEIIITRQIFCDSTYMRYLDSQIIKTANRMAVTKDLEESKLRGCCLSVQSLFLKMKKFLRLAAQ